VFDSRRRIPDRRIQLTGPRDELVQFADAPFPHNADIMAGGARARGRFRQTRSRRYRVRPHDLRTALEREQFQAFRFPAQQVTPMLVAESGCQSCNGLEPARRASNRDTTRGSGPRRLQLGEPLIEYPLIAQSRHRPAPSLDVLTDHQW
jgi:hypothetical protein